MDQEYSDMGCWRKAAIKQGYLIKFHRGLLKAPKMQYFVLTPDGLISFNCKPDQDSVPLAFLPFEQLTSIKVDQIELNSCMLSCMQITSKTNSSFLLAFSRTEERDDWMMATMTAFSEALVSSRGLSRLEASKPIPNLGDGVATTATHFHHMITGFGGQTLRRKGRKRNHGQSLRRSKSYDALTLNDCTNSVNLVDKSCNDISSRLEDAKISYEPSRKRKSEPDIHVISHFPSAWALPLNSPDKEFRNNCFEHRDSLTLLSSKQCKKCDAKTGVISKILSKLEYSTKHVHLKD